MRSPEPPPTITAGFTTGIAGFITGTRKGCPYDDTVDMVRHDNKRSLSCLSFPGFICPIFTTDRGLCPDLIFFSGDLAFGAVEPGKNLTAQYKGVENFLDQVRTAFSKPVPKTHIFLVPGNHDVNRKRVGKMSTMFIDSLDDQDSISDFMNSGGRNSKEENGKLRVAWK